MKKARGFRRGEKVTFLSPKAKLISFSRFHVVKSETQSNSEFAVESGCCSLSLLTHSSKKRSRSGQKRREITRVSFPSYSRFAEKILTRSGGHVSNSVKAGKHLPVYLTFVRDGNAVWIRRLRKTYPFRLLQRRWFKLCIATRLALRLRPQEIDGYCKSKNEFCYSIV